MRDITAWETTWGDPCAEIQPFRQRIQISGPSQYAVQATAQVDNGTMQNCIGLHLWESYSHCLSPQQTPTSVLLTTQKSALQDHGLVMSASEG